MTREQISVKSFSFLD